jgi:hypothetical protein
MLLPMTTVLEELLLKSNVLLCFFCGQNDSMQNIFIKMLPFYGGKCLSRKAIHKFVEKRGKPFAHDEEVETEVRKWLRQRRKDFYATGFRRTGKAMG